MDSSSIPTTGGIYCIVCEPTGKFYIGSAVDLRQRYYRHFGALQRNWHPNRHLQSAWNKYGSDAFTFEVLEYVLLPEMLTAREQHFFDTLKPFGKRGFNLSPTAGSTLGVKYSPEVCEKLSTWQRGRPAWNRGKKSSPEAVEKWRQSMKDYKQTEEHKRNAAATRIGKKRSLETREKMRLSALGHAPTNAKTFILTSPDGTEYVAHNLLAFCRERGLNSSTLTQVAKGNRKQHKGWKARYPDSTG